MRPLQIDPYSDEFQQSPFAAYAALRTTAPVYQVPGHGFYLVTTHALVREVLHDPVTYANSVTSARRTEPLARMEAAAVLRELAQRVDRLEVVDPAAVRYLPSFFLRGIPELPVRVHPRNPSGSA